VMEIEQRAGYELLTRKNFLRPKENSAAKQVNQP